MLISSGQQVTKNSIKIFFGAAHQKCHNLESIRVGVLHILDCCLNTLLTKTVTSLSVSVLVEENIKFWKLFSVLEELYQHQHVANRLDFNHCKKCSFYDFDALYLVLRSSTLIYVSRRVNFQHLLPRFYLLYSIIPFTGLNLLDRKGGGLVAVPPTP